MRCDVLLWDDVCARGKRMLRAMVSAAKSIGIECQTIRTHPTGAPLMMTWGMGHQLRRPIIDRHVAEGGRLIGVDLGYWDRKGRGDMEQSYRITVDHDHPWRLVKPEPPDRFAASGIRLRNDANPRGPIVVVGMGKKSERLYGSWEVTARRWVVENHPGASVAVREKEKDSTPIETYLVNKSLVVCRHSNVAVDACIAGVPVRCEDGIAYALYRENPNPSPAQRLEFLQSVAHWQYKPSEARQAWIFLLKALDSTSAAAEENSKAMSA